MAIKKLIIIGPTSHQNWLRSELLPKLSEQTTAASGALVPHLANRPWIHHLPNYRMPSGQLVDCVVKDDGVNNWPMTQGDYAKFESQMKDLGYEPKYRCESLVIYQNHAALGQCLPTPPACPSS